MAKVPKQKSEFLQNLDKIPPCVARWNAVDRTGDKPRLLTNSELAVKCGLSKRMIQRLSSKNSWVGVKADIVGKFIAGCDGSLTDLAWYEKFLTEFADNNFPQVQDSRMRATVFRCMGWAEK